MRTYYLSVNKGAFTLIELLVVIAIVGLLSTLAVVAMTGMRMKSRNAKRGADADQIIKAFQMYYQDYNKCNGGLNYSSAMNITTCSIRLEKMFDAEWE